VSLFLREFRRYRLQFLREDPQLAGREMHFFPLYALFGR
jgi:hypothetical protein